MNRKESNNRIYKKYRMKNVLGSGFVVAVVCLFLISGCRDQRNSINHSHEQVYDEDFIPTVSPEGTVLLTGKISDPAIKNARLELRNSEDKPVSICGSNAKSYCSAISNSKGKFYFYINKNESLKDYSIISFGGTDTGLDSKISNSYRLDLNNHSQSLANVIITPITSLSYSYSKSKGVDHNAANQYVAKILNIGYADVLKDPELDIDLLGKSILINSIVEKKPSENVFIDFANSIIANNVTNLDESLSLVLQDVYKDAAIVEDMLLIAREISNGSLNGNIDIKSFFKERYFEKSYVELLDNKDKLENLGLKNIQFILESIDKELKVSETSSLKSIPADSFIIDQVARYIGSKSIGTNKLSSVDFINSDNFETEFFSYINNNNNKFLISTIETMLTERVMSVDVPLKNTDLLTSNIDKLNYYFNSTADIFYQARMLSSRIADDQIIEEIYSKMIDTYALYGIHEKAYNLALVGITSDIERYKKFIDIARYTYRNYKNNPSIYNKYLNLADVGLNQIYNTNSDTIGTFSEDYAYLVDGYVYTRDTAKIAETREKYINLLENISNKDLRTTKYEAMIGRYVSNTIGLDNVARVGYIEELIKQEDFEIAKIFIEEVYELINGQVAYDRIYNDEQTLRAQATNVNMRVYHNNSLLRLIAQYVKSNPKDKASVIGVSDKILKEIEKLFIRHGELERKYQGQDGNNLLRAGNTLPEISMHTYYLYDKRKADQIYELRVHDIGSYSFEEEKRDLYYMYKEFVGNFQTGLSNYYKNYPLDEGTVKFKNLLDRNDPEVGTSKSIMMKNFVGNFSPYWREKSFAYYAIEDREYELAYNFVNEFATQLINFLNYKGADKVQEDFRSSLFLTVTNRHMDNAAITGSIRFLNDIYKKSSNATLRSNAQKAARKLVDAGKKVLADSATYDYPDKFKYNFYTDLAYWSKELDLNDIVSELFGLADVIADKIVNERLDGRETHIHILAASDAVTFKLQDKEYVKSRIAMAEESINKLKDLEERFYAYRDIAFVYYEIKDMKNVEASLDKGLKVIKDLGVGPALIYKYIKLLAEKYALYGFANKAYTITKNNVISVSDQNSVIKEIALNLIKSRDLNSTVAFIDTDKDGLVDFFLPFATNEQIKNSNLKADDDIDGDGILDSVDTMPYFYNSTKQ